MVDWTSEQNFQTRFSGYHVLILFTRRKVIQKFIENDRVLREGERSTYRDKNGAAYSASKTKFTSSLNKALSGISEK